MHVDLHHPHGGTTPSRVFCCIRYDSTMRWKRQDGKIEKYIFPSQMSRHACAFQFARRCGCPCAEDACHFCQKIHRKNIGISLDKRPVLMYADNDPTKPAMENSTSFSARNRELPIVERRCVQMGRMDSRGSFRKATGVAL